MSEMNMSLAIPTDDEGYILLKCQLCGEFFKITSDDMNSDDVHGLCCPYCGIESEDYWTDDVKELIEIKLHNAAEEELIFNELKKMERQFNKGLFTLKAGKKPTPVHENLLIAGVDNLVEKEYVCCKKKAKIEETVSESISYCPFCGVMNDGDK